jgi:disulfide bond formation protein DsbB
MLNTLLAIGTIVIALGIISLIIGMILKTPFVSWIIERSNIILPIIFIGAAVGSLVYEHILGYAPCILCWYQRLAIFPVAFLSATGDIRTNPLLRRQVLILAIYGFAIALFHNYLDIFQPAGLSVCGADGISCAVRYVYEFGFITIPLMSGIVLLSGIVLAVVASRYPQGSVAGKTF